MIVYRHSFSTYLFTSFSNCLKLIRPKISHIRRKHIEAKDAQEIYVPIPYGNIAGKEWGNLNGSPIVCLHGLTDTCDSFSPLAPFLSPNFHYIALDSIGHGLTSHPPLGATLNFWDVVTYIRRVVEYFKFPKISILGHSFGGSSGLLFASVYPEKVESMILLDVIKPIPLPLEFHVQGIAEAIDQHLAFEKKMENPNQQRISTMEELIQRYVDHMQETMPISPEAVKLLMKRGSKKSGNGFVYTHDARMLLPSVLRFTIEDQREVIKGLRCHLKIIKAKQGLLYETAELRNEFMQYYQRQCASYEYDETVDGTHHFHMHNPERVAPIINEYFSRLSK